MKVSAYLCDYGNHIVLEKAIMGITPREDMFDRIHSYPIEPHAERAEVHICTECYKKVVLIPASRMVDRKIDERAYLLKVQELGYGMKHKAVTNYLARKRNVKGTKKKFKFCLHISIFRIIFISY